MRSIPILMYHSIDDDVADGYRRWAVSPQRFAQHMSVFAKDGYSLFTISALVDLLDAGSPLPERPAAITFDDGLSDFLTGAAPILERFDFNATLYVVAGLVGSKSGWLTPLGEGQRPMLRSHEVLDLYGSGIEIGAHSMSHPQLDLLGTSAADEEIRTSRKILEDMIGAPVRSFAYPHGYASRTTRRLVREAGYSSAVRVRHALSSDNEDHFGLSRLIITEDIDQAGLRALLGGNDVPVAPPLDRLAADCWRAARRVEKWRQQQFVRVTENQDRKSGGVM